MTIWRAASVCILLALFVPAWGAFRGSPFSRWAGIQLGTSYTILLLSLLTYVLDQSSFIDLPLALAMLSLVATLLFAHFYERWL
jgi:multisubunit Na+/H+ antiporter MnhF subunit